MRVREAAFALLDRSHLAQDRLRAGAIRRLGLRFDRICSLEDDLHSPSGATESLGVIAEETVLELRNPHTNRRLSRLVPARRVYKVRDALVVASTGILYSSDGRFLAEASSWPSEAAVARCPAPPGRPWGGTIEGTCVLLPDNGFYHWLVEDLPSFLLARERAPDATVLVPRRARPYVREALSLLDIDARPISGTVRTRELIIAGRGPVTGWGCAEDVAALRRLHARLSLAEQVPRDVYVSRRLARRSPANESALERAFSDNGYRVIYPEHMSLAEQIMTFAGARRIAGPHGAGLAGMVWADPGSAVLEYTDPAYVNLCYATLANACSHSYEAVMGSRAEQWTVPAKGL